MADRRSFRSYVTETSDGNGLGEDPCLAVRGRFSIYSAKKCTHHAHVFTGKEKDSLQAKTLQIILKQP